MGSVNHGGVVCKIMCFFATVWLIMAIDNLSCSRECERIIAAAHCLKIVLN